MAQRLCALQALRAMAASMVIFAHAQDTYIAKVAMSSLALSSIGLGALGVKLFFCISGFIIYNAGTRFPAGPASVAEFAWRRCVRVVPLYWAATLIYAAKLALQGDAPTVAALAKSLLFVEYNEPFVRPVLGQGWTLNSEMFFYGIFAISLFFQKKFRAPWVVGCFVTVFLLRWFGITTPVGFAPASYLFLLTNMYLAYFLMGMGLAWIRPVFERWIQEGGLSPAVAVGLSAGLLAAYLSVSSRVPLAYVSAELLLAVVVALTVGACLAEKPASDAVSGRGLMAMRAAGDASYSSYLTHGFVMGPAARLLSLTEVAMPAWCFALAMVLACTVVGVLVHHVFEKPVLKRFSGPPWQRAPSSASRPVGQVTSRSSMSGR